ncbi:Pr6Pr family membrane protein [Microbacterium sp.]|uniref:Pr6Pr family membrane protein n=1 Tax=Microbacterium sp. TaxID=51671 RepID=UPI002C407D6F|nr:Pr6Pr family membrane protein [Microbacterium sp.]HWK78389.1 Pr6Pr family membrane protein [Microbacterium sp.]
MTTWWPYVRLAAAVLGLAAIIRQLTLSLGNALSSETAWGGHLPTVIANFFSYFTILSNVLAVIALVIGGLWMLRTRRTAEAEPAWLATLLACASTYMIVTGIVYNLLLRNIPLAGISDVWTNETLHVVIPLVMLADVLFAPRRRALPRGAMLTAVIFPIVWAAYTLIRANFITSPATGNPWWYPYPFLDPHLQGGYLGVIAYILGIAVAIIAVAAFVVWVGRRRGASR